MKSIFKLTIVLLTFYFTQLQAQQMEFIKGGKITFNSEVYEKPKEILAIISVKDSPEMLTTFGKYKSSRSTAQVLGFIGGFGVGASLGGAIGGGKLNVGLLGGGAGVLAIGLIVNNSANSSLEKLVNIYNDSYAKKTSFKPMIKHELGFTSFGVVREF